jgi:hypothetical protein
MLLGSKQPELVVSVAFPNSIPTSVSVASCTRMQLVICDGNPQECGQQDAAIRSVFIHAK